MAPQRPADDARPRRTDGSQLPETPPDPRRRQRLNLAQLGTVIPVEQGSATAEMTLAQVATVRPALDPERFAEAVARTFADHDGARVLVTRTQEGWVQWVDDTLDRSVRVHDVRDSPDPRAEASALCTSLGATDLPLDATTPLTQVHLVLVDDDESEVLVLAHHVAADGVSAWTFRQRLFDWYDHLCGHGPPPAPVARSVTDAWAAAADEDEQTSLSGWAARLDPLPDRLSLLERPGGTDIAPRRATVLLDAADTDALARESGLRTWVFPLVAVTAAYLSRMTSSQRVVLGFTVAGRSARAQRDVVTMLARQVPLVVDLPADADLPAASRVAKAAVKALHEVGPATAEVLRGAVPAAWRLGRVHGPILNILPFDAEITSAGHVVTSRALNRGLVEDMALTVSPREGGLEIDGWANGVGYASDEARRHWERMARLAHLAGAHPQTPLAELDPSLPDELTTRQRWTDTTGWTLVDDAGRPALLGQAGEVVLDAARTGRIGILDVDGTFEDLGQVGDTTIVHGYPVHLERVRRAALAAASVDGATAVLGGRRLVVVVHVASAAVHDEVRADVLARVRAVVPGPVSVRVSVV